MPMHPLIQRLIDTIPADADGSLTADAAAVAAEDLKTTLAALATARAALAQAKGPTPEQRESLKALEQAIFDRRKEAEGLQAQLTDDKAKLAEIEVGIAVAQREHAEIDASITSLRGSA